MTPMFIQGWYISSSPPWGAKQGTVPGSASCCITLVVFRTRHLRFTDRTLAELVVEQEKPPPSISVYYFSSLWEIRHEYSDILTISIKCGTSIQFDYGSICARCIIGPDYGIYLRGTATMSSKSRKQFSTPTVYYFLHLRWIFSNKEIN